MLRQEGWKVNHKRVERIWRQEGLKDKEHVAYTWSLSYVFSETLCYQKLPFHYHIGVSQPTWPAPPQIGPGQMLDVD